MSTDYEEGLAAFSGEYLDGLDEEDKYFWRKLEFDYNTALWEKLDYRDVKSFEQIDDFLDHLEEVKGGEGQDVERNGNDGSDDKEEKGEDDDEVGEDDEWYEDLHEEDVELLDELDVEIENIEKRREAAVKMKEGEEEEEEGKGGEGDIGEWSWGH